MITRDILFLRSEINKNLLESSNERIELLKNIPELKKQLSNMDGVDFFNEWVALRDLIQISWLKDVKEPSFKLEEQQLDRFAFYLDFLAAFFLSNGGEEDKPYLKDVDTFFKQNKKQRGKNETIELFQRAFKK